MKNKGRTKEFQDIQYFKKNIEEMYKRRYSK